MTLLILGLDAADIRLCKRWGCKNLLLDSAIEFKTDSYSIDVPATLEVWPSIATGLKPPEHGILLDPGERKTRSWLHRFANRSVRRLPNKWTERIVDLKNSVIESDKPVTDSPHIFERGIVKNWPGITPCEEWQEEGEWFTAVHDGNLSETEFIQRHKTHLLQQLGWSVGAVEAEYPIAGIHIHFLDHMGHFFAKDPPKLQRLYKFMDGYIGWVREKVDNLLIISDHGMQTTVTNDPSPGVHSYHALAAVKGSDNPPKSIYDVREWAEQRTAGKELHSRSASIDAPTDHLKDLGYI